MKINRKYAPVILASLVLMLFACKKKKAEEPPDNPPTVTTSLAAGLPGKTSNGYLYCSNEQDNFNGNNYVMNAVFNDPAINLFTRFDHYFNTANFNNSQIGGNIRVGDVQFADFTVASLNFQNSLFYNTSFSNQSPLNPRWKTSGNKSFTPLDEQISRGFPNISASVIPAPGFSISISEGFSLDLGGLMSNCDSIAVQLSSGAQSVIQRTVPGAPLLVFKPSDLAVFNPNISSVRILFLAFNYSNRTVNDKVYVFELASRRNSFVEIGP